MHRTFKRTLIVLLCLSILLSLGLPMVSVSAEAAGTSEYLPPVNVGTPLTTSINCRDQVIFNNYNGTNYLYFSAGGTFYVFDVDKYAANPGVYEPVFSQASGIANTRGMAVDSKGIVYAVGDAGILVKYDPATATLSQLSCSLYATAWGLDIDENDNLYIAGRPDIVVKYDSATGSFTQFWAGTATDQVRAVGYGDGFVYANRLGSNNISTLIKVNASTGELIKEVQIPVTQLMYISVEGGVVFGGYSDKSTQVVLDAETLEFVDIGVEGSIMGFTTRERNGKVYFISYRPEGNVLCEYDVTTGKTTVLEGFTDTAVALRCRDPFVTLTIGGTEYKNCIMTCSGGGATPRFFNLDTKTTTIWGNFTGNLTEAKSIRNIVSGPDGSYQIYLGGYLTPNVAVYNTSTKKITASLFSNGHDQTDSLYWHEGKLYAGAYSGAYLVEYDPSAKKVQNLINGLKNDFNQIRIHDIIAGDGKIFFSTIPNTGALGGVIGWYDLSNGRAWIVPQDGHLYYTDAPGSTTRDWYNTAGEKVDVASMTFSGIVPEQVLIALEYQNGLLYGASSVDGGINAEPTQTEAKLMVYDVANTKKLGDYSISQAVTGIADASGRIPYISGIEADPDTAGKFWGVVDETLFSFTYDAASKTMSVKEEVSFAKNGVYGNGGSKNWFPRPILFDGSGYMYVGFGTSGTGIQKIKVSDPSVHEQVAAHATRDYALGDDGNLYFMSGTSLMTVALSKHKQVEQLINAIGTVTEDSGNAIASARAAYDALSEEDQAKVSNLQTLINAESQFAELSNYLTMLQTDYSFIYLPPLDLGGKSYMGLEEKQIATLAEAYENGEINSAYIGRSEGASGVNLTTTEIQCNTKYGEWLAFDLRSPGTGEYNIILNYTTNSSNAKECSVYVLPGETALEDIETALTSAQAVGTADLQDTARTAELGSYAFETDKEYIIVFKATKDKFDGTTDKEKAQIRLAGLELRTYVVTADLKAAQAVQALIDAIGEISVDSADAIAEARSAYEALTDLQKPLVTNLQTLEAAEAALDELMKSMTKVEADYSFIYLPPLDLGGKSYMGLGEKQIATLAEAYENGTINSAYIGKAEGTSAPNLTANEFSCNATYGQWIAFDLRSPGTGEYNIILNYATNSKNTKECSVYVLSGDTALEDIETALTSAQAVGTANLQDKARTAELGSYSFEAGKEYIIVFKATKDMSGGTTDKSNAQLRLASLSMQTYVVTSDLEAAQAVQAKIDAIGDVTLESEETINAARAAYDALTDAQKALVDTTALTAAEAKLAELKEAAQAAADRAAADAVVAKIQAIGEVTLNSEAAIKEAREAYEALTDAQKALIDTFALAEAEERLAQLKEAAAQAAADQAAADAVKAKIEAIGEVTLESGEVIEAARTAYEALTETQKALVDTAALTAAETKLTELKNAAEKAAADQAAADAVKAKIDAIGTVTLESEEAIAAARSAYDALTADQKELVDTTALTAAEAKLTELKNAAEKAAADQAAADAVKAKIDAIGTVTLESEKAIKDARKAYDALTADQKALVPNLSVLKAAESTLAVLLTPETPQTGDMFPLPLLITLLVLSTAGLSLLLILEFRRKRG